MLTESRVRELVDDAVRRLYPSITEAARARIVARFCSTEYCVAFDGELGEGLIPHCLERDKRNNAADYRIVPTPTELLEAESLRMKQLTGDDVSPEERLSIYRRFSTMDEEARIAAAEHLELKPVGAVPEAPVAVSSETKAARKRVIDMTEAEVEAEIALRWGAPPLTGRLASEYRRYRDALIDAERSGPSEADVREVEAAKFLESQRALSPAERIRAHRAAQRVSA